MSKTILLADDSVTIRKVVELTFMDEDYQLVSLGGGEEAVDQLVGVDPDLVIADVHMPGVTGYDVCRAAKETRPERPVLLLVGTFEPFDPAELEASGADRHLKKPFDSQELLETVRGLLAGVERTADPADEVRPAVQDGPEDETEAEPERETQTVAADQPSNADLHELKETVEETAAGGHEPGAEAAAADNGAGELSDETVDRIARRVVELLGPDVLREVAWEVVPDLAEVVIKERLRELEGQVE